jgi:hypothetical protein
MNFYELLLHNVIFTAFLVLGARMVTDNGKVGYPLRLFVINTCGQFWGKPILLCAACMPSLWGIGTTIFMILYTKLDWLYFVGIYPATALCSSYIAGMLWTFYSGYYNEKFSG